ncbi:MAG: MFS transporter [Candidatus Puniceispirillum sp.]|nr:MFS transporter [Candidatus Puniceispirillum sp.]
MAASNSSKSSSLAWTLWAIAALFYAFQYILRVCPSVMKEDMMVKFLTDASGFGTFSGIYYMGYAAAHLPIGVLLDRFGPKWVMASCVMVSVLGVLPLVLSTSWELAILGRFLVGAGSSGAILGVFKIVRLYFPDAQFSRVLGLSVTMGLAGALYGSYPVGRLSANFGWENVLLGLFVGGALLALIMALVTPRAPKETLEEKGTLLRDLRLVFTNKFVLVTALAAALMVGPLEGFADVWANSYLVNVYGYTAEAASFLPSLIFIGMGVGSPVLGYLAQRWHAYYGVTLGCALGMAVLFALLLMVQLPFMIIAACFFLIGMMSAYQVLALYMNSKNVDERLSGIVTALTNMIIMSFGYLFHMVISKVMVHFWDGQAVGCLPVYSSVSYIKGLSVIPLTLMLGFVGFWWVKRATKQA